jgi:hypothetical protein
MANRLDDVSIAKDNAITMTINDFSIL